MGQISAATGIIGAGLSIMGGAQAAEGEKTKGFVDALRYQGIAEQAKTRAIQINAAYQDSLKSTLSTMDAIAAGQGRDIDSATSRVLSDRAREINERERLLRMSDETLKGISAESDATMSRITARSAANAALLKGFSGAMSTLGSSFSRST